MQTPADIYREAVARAFAEREAALLLVRFVEFSAAAQHSIEQEFERATGAALSAYLSAKSGFAGRDHIGDRRQNRAL
jgi:hypothetical protein